MDPWKKIPATHVLVDEKQLLQLFSMCRHDFCDKTVDQRSLDLRVSGSSIRVAYECLDGHFGEWNSEAVEEKVIERIHRGTTCRSPPEKDSRCDFRHMICVESLADDAVFSQLTGIRKEAFNCVTEYISRHRQTGLLATLSILILQNFQDVDDVESFFPSLDVGGCLLVTLITTLRGNILAPILAHCVFGVGTDCDHGASVSLYARFVELISDFVVHFLSDWAIEFRDDWLRTARIPNGETFYFLGAVECFEVPMSSQFRGAFVTGREKRKPTLKFAVLFDGKTSTASIEAIVDWSVPTVTFKDDDEFIRSVAEKRKWRLVGQDPRRFLRRKRLLRFANLFTECADWNDVTEASLRLNVCCLFSNFATIDDPSGPTAATF